MRRNSFSCFSVSFFIHSLVSFLSSSVYLNCFLLVSVIIDYAIVLFCMYMPKTAPQNHLLLLLERLFTISLDFIQYFHMRQLCLFMYQAAENEPRLTTLTIILCKYVNHEFPARNIWMYGVLWDQLASILVSTAVINQNLYAKSSTKWNVISPTAFTK